MTEEEKRTARLNPERYGKWEIIGGWYLFVFFACYFIFFISVHIYFINIHLFTDGDKVNASFIDIKDFTREVITCLLFF